MSKARRNPRIRVIREAKYKKLLRPHLGKKTVKRYEIRLTNRESVKLQAEKHLDGFGPLTKRLLDKADRVQAKHPGANVEIVGPNGRKLWIHWLLHQPVRRNPAKLERCVKSVKKSGSAANPWAVCTAMLRKSKTRRNPVNHDSARELELYVENDGDLYRQMQKPIENNLLRKMKAKKYSSALALKAWQHLMDAGAKKYSKEFGGTWHISFPISERREAARRFRDHFEVEVKAAGGPSKYR